MAKGLIVGKVECSVCKSDMHRVERKDLSYGYISECRKYRSFEHHVKRSIRYNSWREESRLSLISM